MKWLKRSAFCLGVVLLCMLVSGRLLYQLAPVVNLRGSVTYVPIHSDTPRSVGLADATTLRYEDIPAGLVVAVTLREDGAFFQHGGVSWPDIEDAIAQFVVQGHRLRGASTISQQLVKNVFLSPQRSFWRKWREMFFTLMLEKQFPKRQIFAFYASIVEMAPGVYGLDNGARYYFGKEMSALTPAEEAFLATVIHAPTWAQAALADPVQRAKLQALVRADLFNEMKVRHYIMAAYAGPETDDGHFTDYFNDYVSNWREGLSLYYRPMAALNPQEEKALGDRATALTAALFESFGPKAPAVNRGVSGNPRPIAP